MYKYVVHLKEKLDIRQRRSRRRGEVKLELKNIFQEIYFSFLNERFPYLQLYSISN
jgi:hypothetical protein